MCYQRCFSPNGTPWQRSTYHEGGPKGSRPAKIDQGREGRGTKYVCFECCDEGGVPLCIKKRFPHDDKSCFEKFHELRDLYDASAATLCDVRNPFSDMGLETCPKCAPPQRVIDNLAKSRSRPAGGDAPAKRKNNAVGVAGPRRSGRNPKHEVHMVQPKQVEI